VLAALQIPVESQMLVFSKTSLQQRIISPLHPRSIFFNDSVAVGWVPDEPFVEVAVEDPRRGVIFYTLDQDVWAKPVFRRRNDCLTCHESLSTLGVPGMLLRSLHPAANGAWIRELGDSNPDHRTPYEERWGGWYVTGDTGAMRHLGNRTFDRETDPKSAASRLESVKGLIDTSPYLTPYSDVVALLVFEHQMHMMNLLTRGGWEARTGGAIPGIAAQIVDYMLFVDEAPFPGKMSGTSGFAAKFAARGPGDSKGRSLRQLDLERRLMRYPCSYMIYSPAFDALPAELKDAIYRRLWQVLSGGEKAAKYTWLEPADRRTIIEILRDTKRGLPDYFQP
jgi:hypothetical protein